MENWCYARPAAFSTSSASYPGSHAAYMTSVNCVALGCGTAATSPLWSVLENTRTHRAAPMEAPLPHSPPRPPLHPHPRPHQIPPLSLHWRAREAPKPGIFSPSGNSPEVEVVGSFCWSWLLLIQQGLDPSAGFLNYLLPSNFSLLLVCNHYLTEDFFFPLDPFMWCNVEYCLTRMLFATFSIT